MVEKTENMTKEECSLVILGHSNVGKSSLCGSILMGLGMVDQREIQKLKVEARKNGRESWWMAYIMDQDKYEQTSGTTVEVGRKTIETATRKYNVSDCPGHQKYSQNVINSALLTDYAIIVVSAPKNEFLAGFSMGNDDKDKDEGHEGSTRHHFKILKASNCKKIIVAVNKMDHENVQWSPEVFYERVQYITDFVQKLYERKDVSDLLTFIPISAINQENVHQNPQKASLYNWYEGQPLITTLDSLESVPRHLNAPTRIIIQDHIQSDKGQTCFISKIESGSVCLDEEFYYFPKVSKTIVKSIQDMEMNPVSTAVAGQTVILDLKDFTVDLSFCQGVILAKKEQPVACSSQIEVQLQTFKLPSDVFLVAGAEFQLHIHGLQIPCQIARIKEVIDQKGKQQKKNIIREQNRSLCIIEFKRLIAFEKADHLLAKPFGSFLLRSDKTTVAFGSIVRYKPDGSQIAPLQVSKDLQQPTQPSNPVEETKQLQLSTLSSNQAEENKSSQH